MTGVELMAAASAAGAAATGVAGGFFKWRLGSRRIDQQLLAEMAELHESAVARLEKELEALRALPEQLAEMKARVAVLEERLRSHERTEAENVDLRARLARCTCGAAVGLSAASSI